MAMQSAARGGMIAHFRKSIRRQLSRNRLWFRYTDRPFLSIWFTRGEDPQDKALQDFVVGKIDDLKGQDIIALDVQGKSSTTDCMVICAGTSSRHVMFIADHAVQESRAAGLPPLGVEGENSADWVIVDLGDMIVHVMQEESRRLYELEKLWS